MPQTLPVNKVNMMVGTTGNNPTEYGGLVPDVGLPFAMTQWCAATRVNGISKTMYHYKDSTLIGFMGTHQPAIWMGDYGFLTLMPQLDHPKIEVKDRAVPFSHSNETATPYYYSVRWGESSVGKEIKTELTATERCSFFRVSFPAGHKPILFLEAGRGEQEENYVKISARERRVYIYNAERQDRKLGPPIPGFKCYYVLQFNEDFEKSEIWDNDDKAGYTFNKGKNIGAVLYFKHSGNRKVCYKISSSFIGFKQALLNLKKEIGGWDFNSTVTANKLIWNRALNKIKISGGPAESDTIFYTALFRTLKFPRLFSEYGQYYSPFDGKVHKGISYNAYSLWDTFRAEHPLLCLTAPERVNGMMEGLVNMYKESGWIPKWPNPTFTNIMIATHADAVISDAYLKGFRGFDYKTAYKALRKDAFVAPDGDTLKRWADRAPWTSYEARAGLTYYLKLGYVPTDKTNESVSCTLEYALDDFCIAQMAKALHKDVDYQQLIRRSQNYKNVFDPIRERMTPRLSNGSWAPEHAGFTEGDDWTYLFCVMQDVPGMIGLFRGEKEFTKKLDSTFTGWHYRHDNEPGHHMAYLYNYVGAYKKTQEIVAKVLAANYHNQPDGLSGNDDCGQMSAWYVLSTMGIYQVTPASGIYALGKPLFKKIYLRLFNPQTQKNVRLLIETKGADQFSYVQSVLLNGKRLTKPFITHNQLIQGGKLEFILGRGKDTL